MKPHNHVHIRRKPRQSCQSQILQKRLSSPLKHSAIISSQVQLMGAENTEVLPCFVLKYNGDDQLLDEFLTLHTSFLLGPFKRLWSVYLDFLFLIHHPASFWSLPTSELSNSNPLPMPWADGHTPTQEQRHSKRTQGGIQSRIHS